MSIAKSAQHEQPVATIESKPMGSGLSTYEWDGIPIDVLRAFSVELGTVPTRDLEQLRDITSWAKSKAGDNATVGDVLSKITSIRSQLGSPALNEKAYTKVWSFIKSQKVIDEMLKRQDSLR